MNDSVDHVENNAEEFPIKRGRGRPRKIERPDVLNARRPDRVPIHDSRDILTVEGKNPHYEYRWVLDRDESGQRIYKFLNAGYEFATKDVDRLQVGDHMVFKSGNVGSIYRTPAGGNQYLYLMRIRKDWYEEDQNKKQRDILETERTMIEREKQDEGRYGDLKISQH